MSVLDLICSNGFITVNRAIASIVGLEAAAVLGEIATEYSYWQEHDPDFNGEFYSTIENLENRTFLNAYSQRLALSKLQEQGWITVTKKGMPARRFICVHEDKISEVVNDKSLKILTTGDKKNERQAVKNFNGKNNISKNNTKEITNNNNVLTSEQFFNDLPDEPVAEVVDEKEKMFLEFWKIYPKKVDKEGSRRAFKRIKKLKEIFPGIMRALEIQRQSEQWTEKNGKFIPNPTTYIHQERWLTVNEADEIQAYQNELVLQDIQNFNLWRNEDDAQ